MSISRSEREELQRVPRLLVTPDLPEGVTRQQNGLVLPRSPELILPDGTKGLVTDPNQQEISNYGSNHLDEEGRDQERMRAIGFFLAQPWSYANHRLKEAGVQSVVPEITDLVEKRKHAIGTPPELSDAQLTLLKSPFRKKRQLVVDELQESGFSLNQIDLATWPSRTLGLFRVIDLPSIREQGGEDEEANYKDFLITVLDELVSGPSDCLVLI